MATPYFEIPFAQYGDREGIPNGTQSNGLVSFTQGFTADYERDLLSDPQAKNIERKKLNQIIYLLCSAINDLQTKGAQGSVVGVPIPYPSTNVPEGYAPYDGRAFDTGVNPLLRALFPNGYLPDLRGLVIRGLDAGRGLDPNRGILTYQEDTMQLIQGSFLVDVANNNNIGKNLSGAFYDNGDTGGYTDKGTVYSGEARDIRFDSSRVTRTSNETRMKNMAFYYITKVG